MNTVEKNKQLIRHIQERNWVKIDLCFLWDLHDPTEQTKDTPPWELPCFPPTSFHEMGSDVIVTCKLLLSLQGTTFYSYSVIREGIGCCCLTI